jgi:hypothetical protein
LARRRWRPRRGPRGCACRATDAILRLPLVQRQERPERGALNRRQLPEERRAVLDAIVLSVRVGRADHAPRFAVTLAVDPVRMGITDDRSAEHSELRLVLRWTDRDPDGDALPLAAD